jgi:hypothetical protein
MDKLRSIHHARGYGKMELQLMKSHDGLHQAHKVYLILCMKTHFAMQLFKLAFHGALQEKDEKLFLI